MIWIIIIQNPIIELPQLFIKSMVFRFNFNVKFPLGKLNPKIKDHYSQTILFFSQQFLVTANFPFRLKQQFFIPYQYIQFEMNFNLENPSFSQSDDEGEDLLVPSNEMIKEYNREYSMIVGEIERFLKQVKESVQRFVAFHNFGINLNLPTLLQNLLATDQLFKNRLAKAETANNTDPKLGAKIRYEVSFNRLIHKMGELLKEFIDCELEFKKQYFGFKDQKQERMRNAQRVRTLSPQNYSISVSSITNSSKSSNIQIQQIIESEQKQEKREAELRLMLNERLQPKAATIEIECKTEYSTTENLYRLNEKIDRMFEEMKTVKNREEKLIELFNLNRVKKIHAPCYEEMPPFPSTDVSVIEASSEPSEQDEVDSFLEGCRPVMKDIDTITEQGYHPKNRSFAKRPPSLLLAQLIE